jgi:uncharacterized membrane protein YqaE (UPF0057 family)
VIGFSISPESLLLTIARFRRFYVLYLLAVRLPPLAVLMAGMPFQALINIPLTLLVWIPGVIHVRAGRA